MRASRHASTRDPPCARHAVCASAPSVGTPNTGRSAPNARPCATPHAMRTPVNEPGPAPKAMPSRSRSACRRRRARAPISGSMRSECRIARALARAQRIAVAVADGHGQPLGRRVERQNSACAHSTDARRDDRAGTMPARRIRASHDASNSRSNRWTRKAAASRTPTARSCSSRARCPASACTPSSSSASRATTLRARSTIDEPSAARVDAALPALRRLRRLHAAARRRQRCRSRRSSARWRTRCARIGRVRPETLLPPIDGPAWGYRYRARLSVRHVPKKGGVLVGFHERKSSYVADMRECHVLPPQDLRAAAALRTLIESLSIRDAAAADRGGRRRATRARRRSRLRAGAAHPRAARRRPTKRSSSRSPTRTASSSGCSRAGRRPSCRSIRAGATLAYTLPEFDVALPFAPTDFTQVNAGDQSRAGAPRAGACSTRNPASASPISSAGSATSRCRSRGAAPRSSASKAARRWCARAQANARPQRPRRPRERSRARTCSRRPPKRSQRSGRSTAR